MLGVFHFFVGIAMAAGSAALKPVETAFNFIKNLGGELLGANSEYIGDSTQGIVPYIIGKIRKWKASKKIQEAIKDQENRDVCQIIFNEICGRVQEAQAGAPTCNQKSKLKAERKTDEKAIAKLSIQILFKLNYDEYLQSNSETYTTLSPEQREQIIEVIKLAIQAFNEYRFSKIDPDLQIACSVLNISFKDYLDGVEEDLAQRLTQDFERLIYSISEHNSGATSLQAIANAKYAPKYVMRACPGCGYDGPRILVDEKTNSVHCAACGGTYDVLQYVEPEICTEIDKKVDGLLSESKEIQALIKDQGEETKKEIDELKKQLKEQYKAQYKAQLTREYLDACLKGQTDSFEEKFKEIGNTQEKFIADFRERISKVLGIVESQADGLKKELKANVSDVIETLKTKNEEDRRVNAHLSQMLDSLGNQIASLYEYAQGQFEGLDIKSDRILEYVEKMCSKEYYEEMSNALGTDINKAIVREVEAGYNNIAALSATSISQILAAIDDLKSNNTNVNGQVDVSQLEKAIQRENVQLSGQITGLQSLIESNRELINSKMAEHHQESLSLLRIIIKQQDEIKATTLAGAGLNMDRRDFEKIYRGQIPAKYLINRGLPGPFPCPYCGAEEERAMNVEQYCQCSICGNFFFKVDPFQRDTDGQRFDTVLNKKYGHDEAEEEFATGEKIEEWRAKRTAKVVGKCIKAPEVWDESGFYILPNCVDQNYHLDGRFASSITTLALAYGIKQLSDDFFAECVSLQTIIFQPSIDRKYSYDANAINLPYTAKIFGKNKDGDLIHGWVKNK